MEINNDGVISGQNGAGISVLTESSILNAGTATIEGAGGLVFGPYGYPHNLINQGSILGHSDYLSGPVDRYDFGAGAGVYFAGAYGNVKNEAGALISGGVFGFYQVSHEGSFPGSDIENQGVIWGGQAGIFALSGNMSIINSGTIAGGTGDAIVFSQERDHSTSLLTLRTGSQISGNVTGPKWGDSALMLEGRGELDVSGITQMNFLQVTGGGDRWRLTGNTRFTGNGSSTYSGMSTNGILIVDGNITTTRLDVTATGELAGTGSVTGDVSVYGGRLSGRQGEALSINGDLSVWQGNIDVELGAPDLSGLFTVSGNLSLDGKLNVSDRGGFGAGVYRLFDYGLAFTGYGLAIGSVPEGVMPGDLLLQTSVDKQINLVNTAGMDLGFWSGDNSSSEDGIRGGDGTWDVISSNWTDADGMISSTWRGEFAIFQGYAGDVTIDNREGPVSIKGMQFMSDGYHLSGDEIALQEEDTIIRVGNGQQKSADVLATIDSALTGAGGVTKTDYGTLLLNGVSRYTGQTQVRQGTLLVGDENHHDANVPGGVNISPDALLGGYGVIGGSVDNAGTVMAGTARHEGGLPAALRIMGSLNNGGQIVLNNGLPGNTLTVGGNYHGNDGLLSLSTRLGADDSASDRLIIEGNTSGTTQVSVINAGGSGASTPGGIEIIQVKGDSAGEFLQQGRIVAGAYDYRLIRGKGALSGNWYLSNAGQDAGGGEEDEGEGGGAGRPTPVLRAESAAYTANHAAANTLFLPVLPERWREYKDENAQSRSGFWLRSASGKQRWSDGTGQLGTRSHRSVTMLGNDIIRPADNARIGLMGGIARQRGSSTNRKNGITAKSSIQGYSVGAYGFWTDSIPEGGAWLAGWGQYSWFNNSVQGDELRSETYGSAGFSASAEAGYRWPFYSLTHGAFVFEPKARVTWMNVKSDDHQEYNGTRVRSQEETMQTKTGFRLSYSSPAAGSETYVELSWLSQSHPFTTRLDDSELTLAGSGSIAEVRAGATLSFENDITLWGSLTQQTGRQGYSDSQAMAGIRVSF